jgi:predicted RNA-binding protein with PIN domain
MPYIIDGNNLIGSSPDIPLEDPAARRKIIEIVRKFQENKKNSVIIVFDGEPDDAAVYRQPLTEKFTVVYPGFGDSADDEIKRILNRYNYFKDVVLVTSDRELRDYARKKGARIINSIEFHYELKRYYRAQGKKEDTLKRITLFCNRCREPGS